MLFTRELGRIDAVVKGVRKTKSQWGGRLEPFNVCDLIVYPRPLAVHGHAGAARRRFPRLRDDREALAAAAVVCEAAAALWREDEPHERVFTLLRNALKAIDAGAARPGAASAAAARRPAQAARRGRLFADPRPLRRLRRLRPRGRLLRRARRPRLPGLPGDGVPVTPEAVAALRDALAQPLADLRAEPPSAGVEEALRHVHNLYAYHTGQRLRSLRFARAAEDAAPAPAADDRRAHVRRRRARNAPAVVERLTTGAQRSGRRSRRGRAVKRSRRSRARPAERPPLAQWPRRDFVPVSGNIASRTFVAPVAESSPPRRAVVRAARLLQSRPESVESRADTGAA